MMDGQDKKVVVNASACLECEFSDSIHVHRALLFEARSRGTAAAPPQSTELQLGLLLTFAVMFHFLSLLLMPGSVLQPFCA